MNNRVLILGGGLGGLQCGYILSKEGYRVTIVEKEHQVGGCLHSFKRGNRLFDTGFHYVGGLEDGQPLNSFFKYFGLMNLPWKRLDSECFDEVVIDGKSYHFACGYERFAETLASQIGDKKVEASLRQYASFLKTVGDNTLRQLRLIGGAESLDENLFGRSALNYLEQLFENKKVIDIISGTSLTFEFSPKLPLYTFAQINSSFIQSAWRLEGGGSQIANSLAESIQKKGGTILTNSRVTRIIEKSGKVNFVEINSEELLEADYIVSDLHPASTIALISGEEQSAIRPIFRHRYSSFENSVGMFTVNIALKENRLPYLRRNIHIHDQSNIMVSYGVPSSEAKYAQTIDLLAPMKWKEVSKWEGSEVGNRGAEYIELKEKKAEEYIRIAAQKIPKLESSIDKIYTSTPLTYLHYTGSPMGSAYGILKDCSKPMFSMLNPRTPLSNLFLTGQSLNIHGVLGVSMTSFITCSMIIKKMLDTDKE